MHRFYGGNIDWLKTPCELLNAYATMMPIILAEESLLSMSVAIVAKNMELKDTKSFVKDLEKQMSKRQEKRGYTYAERQMMLATHGIITIDMRKKGKKKKTPLKKTD